jgi:hypothetical protein
LHLFIDNIGEFQSIGMDFVRFWEVSMEGSIYNIGAEDLGNRIAFIMEKDGKILGCIDVNQAIQKTTSSSIETIAFNTAKSVKNVPDLACFELMDAFQRSMEHVKEVKK